MKEGWDRAFDEGQKLLSLIRVTDNWIHEHFERDAMEYMKVSGEDESKVEISERLKELWPRMTKTPKQFATLSSVAEEAIEIVWGRCDDYKEDVLEKMDQCTKQLGELRKAH